MTHLDIKYIFGTSEHNVKKINNTKQSVIYAKNAFEQQICQWSTMPKKHDVLTHAVGGRPTAGFLTGPRNLSEESQEVWRQQMT